MNTAPLPIPQNEYKMNTPLRVTLPSGHQGLPARQLNSRSPATNDAMSSTQNTNNNNNNKITV